MRASVYRLNRLLIPLAIFFALATVGVAGAADSIPLSAAQLALFETPHLANIDRPETLTYAYRRVGPDAFSDTIGVHVTKINADGSKDLAFDYLTGDHRVLFPAMDNFRGNPLLMLVLERDVSMMKTALGLSEAYFRNRIRQSFLDAAMLTDTTVTFNGGAVAARTVVITPFTHEERLERIPSLQAKSYTFTLADTVPGMIASIKIDTPADPALHAPEFSEQVTFAGVQP